jgi:hypothetical protein
MTVGDDAAEGAQLLGLVSGRHREIRTLPVAEHTETLEVAALLLDLLGRERAAGRAERVGVELLPGPPVLLLDGVLDGQTVAVPAGDIGCVVTLERARLDDDVLEDLVERVTDVDRAVGVRRAVSAGSRCARSAFMAKPVCGRLMVCL